MAVSVFNKTEKNTRKLYTLQYRKSVASSEKILWVYFKNTCPEENCENSQKVPLFSGQSLEIKISSKQIRKRYSIKMIGKGIQNF